MSTEAVQRAATFVKAGISVLGFISIVIGLHSHFQSAWAMALQIPVRLGDTDHAVNITVWPFEICRFRKLIPDMLDKTCPLISLERYFVSVVIICFFLSLLGFVTRFVADLSSWNFVDASFHGISALLLLIPGIIYAVSALQIHELLSNQPGADDIFQALWGKFRKSEKLAAAVLTIIQSLLYATTAFFLIKT